MRKQSLFTAIVLSLLGTPLFAKYSVNITNNWKKPATIKVVSSFELAPGESRKLRPTGEQNVYITTKRGKKTIIKALPDQMITDFRGVYRPLNHGYSVTIDRRGNVSSAKFME